LWPATWPHEGGIASNHLSTQSGELFRFKYRLPVKRLKSVIVVLIGILDYLLTFNQSLIFGTGSFIDKEMLIGDGC